MTVGEKYNIDLLKIKDAEAYDFSIDSSFFNGFEESNIQEGELDVVITIERSSANTFPTLLKSKGTVKVSCDRCLNLIDFPVESEMEFVIKLTEQEKEDEDEIVYVSAHEAVFRVQQHIYDNVYLSLPIRKTCEAADIAEGCDEQVIEKLERKEDEKESIDPRWNKLKDLLE